MYKALGLLLLPVLAGAAELTVDHVTVAGRNVKEMQVRLASIGIVAEFGGQHSNHATEMAAVSFADGSYLELIAIQPNADPKAVAAHYWAKQMSENAGPCAWAIRAKDLDAEVSRLRSTGIEARAPERNGRARPDGKRLDWETSQIGTEPNGTFFPFLIRDLNPRALRAFPQGKPTSKDFRGVSRVVIAVRDLEAAVTRYRKAFDLPEPLRQVDGNFGAHLAFLGGTPVVLATPLTADSWLTPRLDRFGEGPCAFILGARKAANHKAASKSTWFGTQISWFDSDKLGWRLGYD